MGPETAKKHSQKLRMIEKDCRLVMENIKGGRGGSRSSPATASV